MPIPIQIDKDSEFFIAIAKQGIHSYLMLGVVVQGKPELLASVGKSNLIDPCFGSSIGMFGKVVGSHSQASLVDEGIDGDPDDDSTISYQAYSISFEQYLEFLSMAKEIHEDQIEHYKDRDLPKKEYKQLSNPEKGVYRLRESSIKCYIPNEAPGAGADNSGQVKLVYQAIQNFHPQNLPDKTVGADKYAHTNKRQNIVNGAKELGITNTCRTTARSILNYVLGYSPDVPALFAIELSYNAKLISGKLTSNTFYILPQPPSCFDVGSAKMKVLKELYKKLENIPMTQPSSDTTRMKFDELKHLYLDLSGKPQLSLGLVLDKITMHRAANNTLFDKRRGEGIVSAFAEFLGLKTGTQAAYDRMENAIRKEIARVKPAQSKNSDQVESDDNRPPHASKVYTRTIL